MSKDQGPPKQIIWPTEKLTEPNQIIPIYKGKIELRGEKKTYWIDATVEYRWFPRPRPVIEGFIELDELKDIQEPKLEAFVDGLHFGDCYVVNSHFSSDHPTSLYMEGFIHESVTLGDTSISVEHVRFSIPNLRYIRGLPAEFENERGTGASIGRTIFQAKDHELIIDAVPKCAEKIKNLGNIGGYDLTYGGSIRKLNGSITYKEAIAILEPFEIFLGFVNGRKINIMFHQGVFEEEVLFKGYKGAHLKGFSHQQSWLPELSPQGLDNMWKNFFEVWKKGEDDREALRMSILWYLEALGGVGYIEGGIIMAQTSLELLYNWILIDTRQLLVGSDAVNISAANKLRLLLAQMQVSSDVPDYFKESQNFVASYSEITDFPDVIVQIRNALVHAQLEKRKKLNAIPTLVKYQALTGSLWYIELAILYMLKYNSSYQNRTDPMSGQYDNIPWKSK